VGSYPTPELFRSYPELRERLPWVSLARPTQVQRLVRLESHLRSGPIWVKRDDQTSDVLGGDKARQFEFLFGDLLRRGCRRVVTFGGVGSEHCLAVTAFAHHFHLRPILALVRSPQARNVQQTLEIEHQLGAELHRLDGGPAALWRLGRSLFGGRADADEPRLPYVLWPDRAALLGALGYVNAACEMARQIRVGILPEPERIYVPVGRSGATAAGLLLGCQMAGIRSTIVGVATRERGRARPLRLAERAARLLSRKTRRFPNVPVRRDRFVLRRDLAGGSGMPLAATHHAIGLVRELETLEIDAANGGRGMAALVSDLRGGRGRGPVLFWHTRRPHLLHRPEGISAAALPREFREFFVAR
jgi:D-cysteine desulfhydrase